jgi:DNA-directed RNA polymerase subunit M/transcription elongation factor TFIIS
MYYIRLDIEDSNKLIYYCRHCGNEEDNILNTNSVVYSSSNKSNLNTSNIINEFTKLDPTLPRVSNILCPNEDCSTNKEKNKEREILYIRYDDINMKYIYLCADCDSVWEVK